MKFTRRQFGIGFGTLASYAMTDSRFGLGEPASIGEGVDALDHGGRRSVPSNVADSIGCRRKSLAGSPSY